jgi:3-deoxy-D-manno-octulosonic-acid transferase
VYNAIDRILTVSEADREAFGLFRLTHPVVEPVGDTRYDQVVIRSAGARQRHLLPASILEGRRVLVVGSSWPEDEEVLLPAIFSLQHEIRNLLVIFVPHEPTVEHLEDLEADLAGHTGAIRFSALNEYSGEQVIIVDSIGILSVLYAAAHIAYIGGSFRQGVHNVLEAAVFGIPVLFGPRHRNSREPLMLVERGGAFVVSDTAECVRALHNLLDNESARRFAGERAAAFVQSQVGATDRFLRHLEEVFSLAQGPENRP